MRVLIAVLLCCACAHRTSQGRGRAVTREGLARGFRPVAPPLREGCLASDPRGAMVLCAGRDTQQ